MFLDSPEKRQLAASLVTIMTIYRKQYPNPLESSKSIPYALQNATLI
jgi:hypothetical protein